jgi:hypothetical protein
MGTGSLTSPDQPSRARRYQNRFSSTVSSKYSLAEKVKRIATLRGSPPGVEISKWLTERLTREERRSAESDGWMY